MYKLKLLAFSALLWSTGAIQAQNFDVAGTQLINPSNGDIVTTEVGFLRFSYTNNGDAIEGANGDTVRFTFLVDGVPYVSYNRDMTEDFFTGELDTSMTLILTHDITPGIRDFCIVMSIIGQTDNDASNDTVCVSVDVQEPDVSFESFQIDTPSLNPGDSLEINKQITGFTFTIKNNGNQNFRGQYDFQSRTYGLPFILSVDGTDHNLRLVSTQQEPILIAPGQSSTVAASIRSLNVFAPSTAKTFDICMTSNLTRDADHTNDEHCETYRTFDPASVPNSVQEVDDESNWNITSLDQGFNLSGFYTAQREISIRVLSITGAEVLSQTIAAEGRIDETVDLQAPAGVYLVQVIQGAEVLHTERIYRK